MGEGEWQGCIFLRITNTHPPEGNDFRKSRGKKKNRTGKGKFYLPFSYILPRFSPKNSFFSLIQQIKRLRKTIPNFWGKNDFQKRWGMIFQENIHPWGMSFFRQTLGKLFPHLLFDQDDLYFRSALVENIVNAFPCRCLLLFLTKIQNKKNKKF